MTNPAEDQARAGPAARPNVVLTASTRTQRGFGAGVLDVLGPQSGWTIQRFLDQWADHQPQRVAAIDNHGGHLTYGQLRDQVRRFAAGLADRGVRQGDRVAVLMDNHVDYLVAWFAINEVRAVQVPMNTASRGAGLRHMLENSDARLAIVDQAYLDVLIDAELPSGALEGVVVRSSDADAVDPRADEDRPWQRVHTWREVADATPADHLEPCDYRDAAGIMYTSGTTGPAKGVVISQAHMCMFAAQVTYRLELSANDTFFVCLPMFHANAQFMQVLATLLVGGSVVIEDRFSASRWLSRVRETAATASSLLGVMAQFVYQQPAASSDRDHQLRRMMTIPVPAAVALDFERRFGVECCEAYGMTEVCLVTMRPFDEPLRPGSCGRVMDELYDVDLVDPDTQLPVADGELGEFVVRPRLPFTTFLEYHDMPERTVEAWRHLWFHTGDAGRRDSEGHYYFVDRIQDRIRRRGENVTAYEVESALMEHDQVLEVAVIAVPASEGEDDIKAFVVLAGPLDEVALLEHAVKRLPYFAVPRYFEVVSELPKTETGKLLKRTLRVRDRSAEWDREAAGFRVTRAGLEAHDRS